MWLLIALRDGPREIVRLLDAVRALDGPIGPGTLFATVARLERLDLVESARGTTTQPSYRLTALGLAAAASAVTLKGGDPP